MISCGKCKSAKLPTDFYPSQLRRGGWCKTCCKSYNRSRWQGNKAYARERSIRAHGITGDDYQRMLAAQGGRCANLSCQAAPAADRPLQIDHDHSCCLGRKASGPRRTCGKCIRGLLCFTCNLAAGNPGDNYMRIIGLADYLKPRQFDAGIAQGLL